MASAKEVYGAVAEDLEWAKTLRKEAYTDDRIFLEETEAVFRAGWLPVARVKEVPEPGAYKSVDLIGDPLVVTRDMEGQLHVMSRVCRHRAMPVVEGQGAAKAFSCPYHLWRYNLDGMLVSAPGMEKSACFNRGDNSLLRVRHEEWGGWVFVNLSGDAQPLKKQLQPLADRLDPFDPESFVKVGTLEFESPWNWKVMVENFLESYHHIGTHTETLQRSNPGLGTFGVDVEGPFALLENPARSEEHEPFTVACVFPLALMAFGDRFATWYEFCDIEHSRFLLKVHVLLPEEIANDPAIVEASVETLRAVHLEDIDACMGLQKGLHSSHYAPGPMSDLEKCNWQFHHFLRTCFEQPERRGCEQERETQTQVVEA